MRVFHFSEQLNLFTDALVAADGEGFLLDFGVGLDFGLFFDLRQTLRLALDPLRTRRIRACRLTRSTVVFPLAVEARVTLGAVAFPLAVRAAAAHRAVVFQLAVGVFLPIGTSLSSHGSRAIV